MLVEKYREACAQARAALRPLKDPDRKLTDSERHAIIRHVDNILGLTPPEGEEYWEKYMKDGKFRYCPSEFNQPKQNPESQPAEPLPSPQPVVNPP